MTDPENSGEFGYSKDRRPHYGVNISKIYNFFKPEQPVENLTDQQVAVFNECPWQCPRDKCKEVASVRIAELSGAKYGNDDLGFPTEVITIQRITPIEDIVKDDYGYVSFSGRCTECDTCYDMNMHVSLMDDFEAVRLGADNDITKAYIKK